MKWDFFYDETEGNANSTIKDCYKDIQLVTTPTILVLLVTTIYYLH